MGHLLPQVTFSNFLAHHEGHQQHGGAVKRLGLFKGRRARRQAQEEAHAKYQGDVESGAFDGTFLEWLMEHADEIFAMILKIMTLLGV